jgi:hypothetical protein
MLLDGFVHLSQHHDAMLVEQFDDVGGKLG